MQNFREPGQSFFGPVPVFRRRQDAIAVWMPAGVGLSVKSIGTFRFPISLT
jgi:hypothetical protein